MRRHQEQAYRTDFLGEKCRRVGGDRRHAAPSTPRQCRAMAQNHAKDEKGRQDVFPSENRSGHLHMDRVNGKWIKCRENNMTKTYSTGPISIYLKVIRLTQNSRYCCMVGSKYQTANKPIKSSRKNR